MKAIVVDTVSTHDYIVVCRKCGAETWLTMIGGLPPRWKIIHMNDYLDEFECGNHE